MRLGLISNATQSISGFVPTKFSTCEELIRIWAVAIGRRTQVGERMVGSDRVW